MAGVIMASPKKNAAPIMPRASTKPPFFWMKRFDQHDERQDAAFALLSARIRNTTYFSVTMRIRAQMSSEATPSTAARRSPPAVTTGCSASRMA